MDSDLTRYEVINQWISFLRNSRRDVVASAPDFWMGVISDSLEKAPPLSLDGVTGEAKEVLAKANKEIFFSLTSLFLKATDTLPKEWEMLIGSKFELEGLLEEFWLNHIKEELFLVDLKDDEFPPPDFFDGTYCRTPRVILRNTLTVLKENALVPSKKIQQLGKMILLSQPYETTVAASDLDARDLKNKNEILKILLAAGYNPAEHLEIIKKTGGVVLLPELKRRGADVSSILPSSEISLEGFLIKSALFSEQPLPEDLDLDAQMKTVIQILKTQRKFNSLSRLSDMEVRRTVVSSGAVLKEMGESGQNILMVIAREHPKLFVKMWKMKKYRPSLKKILTDMPVDNFGNTVFSYLINASKPYKIENGDLEKIHNFCKGKHSKCGWVWSSFVFDDGPVDCIPKLASSVDGVNQLMVLAELDVDDAFRLEDSIAKKILKRWEKTFKEDNIAYNYASIFSGFLNDRIAWLDWILRSLASHKEIKINVDLLGVFGVADFLMKYREDPKSQELEKTLKDWMEIGANYSWAIEKMTAMLPEETHSMLEKYILEEVVCALPETNKKRIRI